MLRNYYLSSGHYASKWVVREVSDRHDREIINQKAYDFATTTDPVLREKLQLEVLEAFHGYLIKYFNLIVYADVPALAGAQGKDAQAFLRLLLPPGTPASVMSLRSVAKHLHLAFKDAVTSDEVYDTLVTVFLDVAAHYDPHYNKKTEEVCKYIEKQPADTLVRVDELSATVDFDPIGCIRVLVRHDYLESVSGPRKKVQGYKRGPSWPPAPAFFESGPVGFTYYATKWFRYYLQEYIRSQMAQIESKEHVLQLEHAMSDNVDGEGFPLGGIPHAEGNWVDQRGVRWQADISMLDHWKSLDVSTMTDEWVKGTEDFLFRTLKPSERYLLQLHFAKDLTWAEIGTALGMSAETASIRFKEIMLFLENRAKAKPTKMLSNG